MSKSLCALIAASVFMLIIYGTANARVKGVCQACHTMHNSQGGQPMATQSSMTVDWWGEPIFNPSAVPFWSGNTINTANTNSATPMEHLLRTDCIGCHSNTGKETIVYYMGNKVPIVHNTTKPDYEIPGADNALAGGNFYWVDPASGADFADSHGHNIFSYDPRFYVPAHQYAPGNITGGCTVSCHWQLYGFSQYYGAGPSGCEGCHFYTWHHKKKAPFGGVIGTAALKTDPTYRFLAGHRLVYGYPEPSPDFVQGIEDPNFEQSPSAAVHNVYMANGASVNGSFVAAPTGLTNSNNHSLSGYCAACHGEFHVDQKDSAGVWIRHPVDVLVSSLVSDGHEAETFFYNGPDGYGANNYDPAAPVAFGIADPYTQTAASYSTISAADGRVTCVSCHRTHASPYPSMLRFNYNAIIAGNSATAGGNGCFACHTEKSLQ